MEHFWKVSRISENTEAKQSSLLYKGVSRAHNVLGEGCQRRGPTEKPSAAILRGAIKNKNWFSQCAASVFLDLLSNVSVKY